MIIRAQKAYLLLEVKFNLIPYEIDRIMKNRMGGINLRPLQHLRLKEIILKIILAAEWNVPSILAIFNQVNNIPEKGL